MKNQGPILFITAGGTCNNNCFGCSTPQERDKFLPTDRIIDELKLCAREGYGVVHFFGGEITINKDFLKIIKTAKTLFKAVFLTTNARIFSYEKFAEKAKLLEIDLINISLHGHRAEIHDAWTRTPDSFFQTFKGLKNLQKHGLELNLNHVLWRGNYEYADNFLRFTVKQGIDSCVILNLDPIGLANKNYDSLSVNLKDLLFLNQVAKKYSTKIRKLTLEDFPFCLFSAEVLENNHIHILNSSGKITLNKGLLGSYGAAYAKECGFGILSNRLVQKNFTSLLESFKDYAVKPSCCNGCTYVSLCDGIFKKYVKKNGLKNTIREIRNLRSQNQKNIENE